MKQGDRLEARVVALDQRGAWVEHQGIRAFVPLAELAWYEIEHPTVSLGVGDLVRVRLVKKMEDGVWACSVRRVDVDGTLT
ncbi:S1 RNA-binding domain-containing protein [Ferroacidibacillus organovorans]|uniref:S1 motif domain-containing protein n=1 Tax=Ferroacidibacillus organovorans TaxID=1765683 RepID=A0A853KEB5_9BACL|nr:S1 RNA-binding domain-containing protein [Ferroacidibacillus organovorans]KYP79561.1 hypothetical protein AYJ22_14260 [Ferroacidibacillus organovorans]OAG94761.1 hypothetical protein AYW79_03095 [Ferroacidibacillus organovorans]